MRKFRVHTERTNLRVGSSIKLEDFEADHLRKSLRVKKGDEVVIFNGEKEFEAHLTLVSKDAVMAEIDSISKTAIESEVKIHLFQALNKSKSFEFVLEKATELGVNQITPLETEYTVVKASDTGEKKMDRWNKIILSACKQSERIDIPSLSETISIQNIENILSQFDLVLFLSTEKESRAQKIVNTINSDSQFSSIAVIIGPEGGFSPLEVELLTSINNVKAVSISNNILRSETAAIVALGYLKIILFAD